MKHENLKPAEKSRLKFGRIYIVAVIVAVILALTMDYWADYSIPLHRRS